MRFLEDIAGIEVIDSGQAIGVICELVFDSATPYPKVVAIGIEFQEVERLGGLRLLEPVVEIKAALPWSQVGLIRSGLVELKSEWQETMLFDFMAPDLLLARGDLLDTQIVDCDGRKIQRVDDIVLGRQNGNLFLLGLQTSIGGMIKRFDFEDARADIAKDYEVLQPERLIPWTAVSAYDRARELLVLKVDAD